MKISSEACRVMLWLTEKYVAGGLPNHKVWNFSPAPTDTVFPELRAAGYIEQMGTRGGPFRLTDAGHHWVMANRNLPPSPDDETRGNREGQEHRTERREPRMYNLLVTATVEAWDKPNYVLDVTRYLEHTDDDVRERLEALDEENTAELRKLPALFAYETHVDAPARVGWIADIQRRQSQIRITPRFDPAIPPIAPERIESLKWELGIDDWEMSRTHWAVKTADLFVALDGRKADDPVVPPYEVPVTNQALPPLGDRVFIVHGRHDGAKHEVARFLEQIGIEAVILHERPNGGRTLITKFQDESAGIPFAVVLMTPDDVGGLVGEAQNPRARQNVIFELGFFIGRIGAAKVCALLSGDIEKPSDFDAIVYIQYGPSTGWKTELARELRHAGVKLDANRVF